METLVTKAHLTRLQGYLKIDFNKLVSVLGNNGIEIAKLYESGKSKAIWILEGEISGEKIIATIYDWKESRGVHYLENWHIGGHNKKALELVKHFFPNNFVTQF